LGVLFFVLAVFVAIFITMLTISYQSWQTARMDPVESLKYE
jgi:ABC-type antimicrobial peptide transport system permease subunit